MIMDFSRSFGSAQLESECWTRGTLDLAVLLLYSEITHLHSYMTSDHNIQYNVNVKWALFPTQLSYGTYLSNVITASVV